MKKLLLVVCLVLAFALSSYAADTNYAFYFRDTAGNAYCDGMSLRLYTPSPGSVPKAIVGGYHFYYDCVNYASVGGFKHALNYAYQYAASGAVLDVVSPAYGLQGLNQSEQYLINPKYHTWILYTGNDFYGNYVFNYGTWINNAGPIVKNGATKSSSRP